MVLSYLSVALCLFHFTGKFVGAFQSLQVASGGRLLVGNGRNLGHTGENERATYLESHTHSVAVIPRVVSMEKALKLHEAVDRRWRSVNMADVKRLAAAGYGDDDGLVEMVDSAPSLSADIISGGSCTAVDQEHDKDQDFMLPEDCNLARTLLQTYVTPLVEKKMKEWKAQGATDFPETLYVCDSFVRRYMPAERHELHPHRDTSSLLTVNVLLTDPSEFQGGLVMYPEADELSAETQSEKGGYLEDDDMGKGVFLEHGHGVGIGDLVLHRGSLWHGVQMLQPEKSRRYSWITWYSRSREQCDQDN